MSVQAVLVAMNKTAVAEVVRHVDNDMKLHVVHRIRSKQLSVWVAILNYVLSRKKGWDAHVCKQYFYADGKIKYAWNFIIQWTDPRSKEEVLHQVANLLLAAACQVPAVSHSLDSYPLIGSKESRNQPEGAFNPTKSGYRQKGAHKIGGIQN